MFLFRQRFWKRVGFGALVLIGVFIVAYIGLSLWANRLSARLEHLRSVGEPTCIAELAPRPVPGKENGAAYLAEIAPEIETFAKDHGRFLSTPMGESYVEKVDKGEQPSAEEITAIGTILDRYPTIEPALRKAVDCTSYASQLDYSLDYQSFLQTLLNEAQNVRACARLLDWKSRVLLADENVEGAVQAGLLVMQLSRLQEQEPALVNGLVAVALRYNAIAIINRALRSGSIGDDSRISLGMELAKYDELDWFVRTMKSERALNLSAAIDLFPHFPVTWQGTFLQADMIDFYENYFPLAAKPMYLSSKEFSALEHDSYSTPISSTLIQLFLPAIESGHEAANSNLALIRCLRVLNALQAYKETHGKVATEIADLDLPESATIDPFDGKPLKLKWTEDGWIIYSVYKDGVDDGGEFDEQQDIGLGPAGMLP